MQKGRGLRRDPGEVTEKRDQERRLRDPVRGGRRTRRELYSNDRERVSGKGWSAVLVVVQRSGKMRTEKSLLALATCKSLVTSVPGVVGWKADRGGAIIFAENV